MGSTRSSRSHRRLRRDRRGRGLRGPLLPATLPASSSKSERFDAAVVEALEPIEARWHAELVNLDVAVDDVPDVRKTAPASDGEGVLHDGSVPLSRLVPAGVDQAGLPTRARIVLYRRPIEMRAPEHDTLVEFLHQVLVEQIAVYLGLDPDIIEGH
ncbi:metallopeptidase family protein [Haloechinothrix sp. LS1_15]|uniref:metallopeptidase family protein n=1 Tax=Haloechinothrix sp. LS1_15 TaxID=2652248 RepID=UPI0029450D04|nr:metallopeptidase family protein [Haloechinothrix sp. LS1_15]MDV6011560.1 metallopeptidase family protein [Haloechinothrix sp. LS1_15]